MRIAICGTDKKSAISKLESVFGVEVKNPWSVDGKSGIVDYAAETYKYYNETDVLFNGSAFDFLLENEAEGYFDVCEQIAINTLDNVDKIIVMTSGMSDVQLKMYQDYASISDKFCLCNSDEDINIIKK